MRHNAGHAAYGAINLDPRDQGLLRQLLLQPRRLLNADPLRTRNGGALQQWARQFGIGRTTGIDLGGENAGTCPTPDWRAGRDKLERAVRARAPGPFKRHSRTAHPGRLRDRRRPTARGRWATTSTSPSARATSRSRRCSWRSPTRRSPTAAPSCARTSASRSTRRRHACCRRSTRRPPATSTIDPPYLDAIRAGLHDAASQPGGTSADVFGNFPAARSTARPEPPSTTASRTTSWYAATCPTATDKPIVVVVTVEQGGFGAVGGRPGRAPDPVAVVLRQAAASTSPGARRHCERRPPIQIRRREAARPAAARRCSLFDPLLLLRRSGWSPARWSR